MKYDTEILVSCLSKVWVYWTENKQRIKYFGFKEYVLNEYGFVYTGSNVFNDFEIIIKDEEKFALFILENIGES